jgi:hypothetical protein
MSCKSKEKEFRTTQGTLRFRDEYRDIVNKKNRSNNGDNIDKEDNIDRKDNIDTVLQLQKRIKIN